MHKPDSKLENETQKILWDTNKLPNTNQKTKPSVN